MSKRQLAMLFLIGSVGYTVGNGLIPLLPVYARRLGASPDLVGYYLAFSYVAIAAGTVGGGWLADKIDRRKELLVCSGLLCIPPLWLMGIATDLWQLVALTAMLWMMFGVGGAQLNIIAGLFASQDQRGKVFGILGFSPGVGSIVGGLSIGFLADQLGYSTMFLIMALLFVPWPLAALIVEDKPVGVRGIQRSSTGHAMSKVPVSFILLLAASTLVFVSFFGQVLARSLAMSDLGFNATAITAVQAITGVVCLPIPFLLGLLSDRLGRKRSLAIPFSCAFAGLLVLAVSTSFWHFALAGCLLNVLIAGNAVGAALTRDLLPRQALGRGMSAFTATTWVGGIVGFGIAGRAVQGLGTTTAVAFASLLPLLALILLIPIQEPSHAARTRDAV